MKLKKYIVFTVMLSLLLTMIPFTSSTMNISYANSGIESSMVPMPTSTAMPGINDAQELNSPIPPESTLIPNQKDSDPGQGYIIKYRDSNKRNIIRDKIKNLNGKIKKQYEKINAVLASLDENGYKALANDEDIEYIENDYRIQTEEETIPWGVQMVNAPAVHELGYNGSEINIAILDTGISQHEDLSVCGGISFIDGVADYQDDNGHGTHVAGIISSLSNGKGIIGTAPSSNIYSVKVLDSNGQGSYSSLISAIEWSIDNDIDIINMSFGGNSFSRSLEEAINLAYNNGILLVASSGNNGTAYDDSITYPARYDNVIAVGAVDRNGNRADFSSVGPEIDLVAPGVEIYSTTYDGKFGVKSGTSMSAAHVTGIAALLWNKDKGLSCQFINDVLCYSASEKDNSNYFGYGQVDAKAAYNLLIQGEDTLNKIKENKTPKKSDMPKANKNGQALLETNSETVYLSDISWHSASAGWGTVKKDRSIEGRTITLNGITYAKGIGTHAISDITYFLGGSCNEFICDVGIDDECDSYGGSVIFQVWGDGVMLYDSGTMTVSTPTISINLNISGVNQLNLKVTDSGNGIYCDHADWAGARFTSSPDPDVLYLSDISWLSASCGWGTIKKDQSIGGKTITLNGATYSKGIGTHANSTIIYQLNGNYTDFKSEIGIDDECYYSGSVIFQVWGDDILLYDSGVMRYNTVTQSINLNISGINELKLIVTDSGDSNYCDHADWAGTRLVELVTTPPFPGILSTATPPDNTSVRLVQERLNSLLYKGYNGFMLDEDGAFGPNCEFAVQKFQEYNNIRFGGDVYGQVDVITWNELFSDTCINAKRSSGPFLIPEQNVAVTKNMAEIIAEEVVAQYEGGLYALAGNYDGAGLSVGYIQCNFKSYSLQPVLIEMANGTTSGTVFENIFNFDFYDEQDHETKKGYEKIREVLTQSLPEQLAWGETISNQTNRYFLIEPWKTPFSNLVRNDTFLDVYKNNSYVRKYYDPTAYDIMDDMGTRTVRSYILAFDISVNNGVLKDASTAMIEDAIDGINNESNPLVNPEHLNYDTTGYDPNSVEYIRRSKNKQVVQDLLVCINNISDINIKKYFYTGAAAALQKPDGYSWDSWTRKKAIIQGIGTIHGIPVNSRFLTDNPILY